MSKLFPVLLLLLLPAIRALYNDALTYEQLPSLAAQPSLLFVTVRWCDHCNSLKPEIKVLSRATKASKDVLIARVDADEEPGVSARFGISGFPSILFFPSGYDLSDKNKKPVEYTDWRWAEVIAEFVNNATGAETISLKPRDRFLRWRKSNPWNRAIVETEDDFEEVLEGAYDDGISRMPIREPTEITTENVEEIYDPLMRYMVLFYRSEDPFIKDLRLQWRQASSAFSGAENVTVGLADITDDEILTERFNISETPACRYFPRCEKDCNVVDCADDMDNTENIIQFLSDRVMQEMGIFPDQSGRLGPTYTLTEEQYQKMKSDGVVFANDEDSEEQVREIYEQRARGMAKGIEDEDTFSDAEVSESIDDQDETGHDGLVNDDGDSDDPSFAKEEL